MYTLKAPNQSQFSELSKAFNDFLTCNKVEMSDRRSVTAYALGRIIGGSLPVFDMPGPHVRSKTFRDQYLPMVKAWLGRVGEGLVIDHELAIIGGFQEWVRRSLIAFPAMPALTDEQSSASEWGAEQQTAALQAVVRQYPKLELGYVIPTLLVTRGE